MDILLTSFLINLFALISVISAQEGTLSIVDEIGCDSFNKIISNQSDIDIYSKCPVLEDWLVLNHSFTGPFELPGVRSVGEFAVGYFGPKIGFQDRALDGVTSISMPDLVNVTYQGSGWGYALWSGYCDNLTDISLPKLQLIDGYFGISHNDVRILTLPSLANVTGGVWLSGNFDEIHLPSLKTVRYLRVESTGKLDCVALGKNLSTLAFTPLEDDEWEGFTCRTRYQGNTYNSSAPASSTSSTLPPSSTTSGIPSTTSTDNNSPTPSTTGSAATRMTYHGAQGVWWCAMLVATLL